MVNFFGIRKYSDTYKRERQEFEEKYSDILNMPDAQTFLKNEWEKRKTEISERLLFRVEKRKQLNYLSDVFDSDYDLVNDIFWLYFSMVEEEHDHLLSLRDAMKYSMPAIEEYLRLNHPLRKPLPEKYTREFLEKFEAHRIDK